MSECLVLRMADIPGVPGKVEMVLAEDRFLQSLAVSLLGPGPEAEDAVQHAWLRSLEVRTRHKRGFLARVLRNRVLNLRRDQNHRLKHDKAAAKSEAVPSAEEMASREELRRRVGEAILALQEPYRGEDQVEFAHPRLPRTRVPCMNVS